jgi:hypothetical protein
MQLDQTGTYIQMGTEVGSGILFSDAGYNLGQP